MSDHIHIDRALELHRAQEDPLALSRKEPYRQLYRGPDEILGGVCAGIAAYTDQDVVVIRLATVFLSLATLGLGAALYLIMWISIEGAPVDSKLLQVSADEEENGGKSEQKTSDTSYAARSNGAFNEKAKCFFHSNAGHCFLLIGISCGLSFLMLPMLLSIFPGVQWWRFWPFALAVLGVVCMATPRVNGFSLVQISAGLAVFFTAVLLMPIALGIFSAETLWLALKRLWLLLAASVVLLILGKVQKQPVFYVIAALCVGVLCLLALLWFSYPGDLASLVILAPTGRQFIFSVA